MLVSSISSHTVILDSDRRLWSFGRNCSGQLGRWSSEHDSRPGAIAWKGKPIHGCVGAYNTIFLNDLGELWYTYGVGLKQSPIILPDPHTVEFMEHSLYLIAIVQGGELTLLDSHSFIPLKLNMSNVRSVACGFEFLLVEGVCGGLWASGNNAMGQLGLGHYQSIENLFQAVELPADFPQGQLRSLSAGMGFCVLVDHTGSVWTTGSNSAGQLGSGSDMSRTSFQRVEDIPPMKRAVAGGMHVLAVGENGQVWGWGCNASGQLGLSSAEHRNAPQVIPELEGVWEVKAGKTHSLAISKEGSLLVFGHNAFGQLGLGDLDNRFTPQVHPSIDPLPSMRPRSSQKSARSASRAEADM